MLVKAISELKSVSGFKIFREASPVRVTNLKATLWPLTLTWTVEPSWTLIIWEPGSNRNSFIIGRRKYSPGLWNRWNALFSTVTEVQKADIFELWYFLHRFYMKSRHIISQEKQWSELQRCCYSACIIWQPCTWSFLGGHVLIIIVT